MCRIDITWEEWDISNVLCLSNQSILPSDSSKSSLERESFILLCFLNTCKSWTSVNLSIAATILSHSFWSCKVEAKIVPDISCMSRKEYPTQSIFLEVKPWRWRIFWKTTTSAMLSVVDPRPHANLNQSPISILNGSPSVCSPTKNKKGLFLSWDPYTLMPSSGRRSH